MKSKATHAPPTAEQIARKLGVSNATVSRVLNNGQNVSPQMREAVLAAIRESGAPARLLGPRPAKPAAQSTAKLDFMQIINIARFPIANIPDNPAPQPSSTPKRLPQSQFFSPAARLATSYARHIIDGIVDELGAFGKRALIQVTPDLNSPQILGEASLPENHGIFLLGTYGPDILPFLDRCQQPVVTFVTWDQSGQTDYVGIDNHKGIRLAFEHLAQLGHTRIGYIAGELRYSAVFKERLTAYKALVADANWRPRPDWIIEGSCDLPLIQTDVEKLLASSDRPSAILCCFDGAAVAVKRAAERLGLQVPRDLSVVGFDDEEIAHLFSPPLTTVRIPTLLMGRQAVQIMMLRQQRPIQPGEGFSIRVTPTLIVRESTAPPFKPTGKTV